MLTPTVAIYILGATAAFCLTAFGFVWRASTKIEEKGEDFYNRNLEAAKKVRDSAKSELDQIRKEIEYIGEWDPSTAEFRLSRMFKRFSIRATAVETITELKRDSQNLGYYAFWVWTPVLIFLFLLVTGVVAFESGYSLIGVELIFPPLVPVFMVESWCLFRWNALRPKVAEARNNLEDGIRNL